MEKIQHQPTEERSQRRKSRRIIPIQLISCFNALSIGYLMNMDDILNSNWVDLIKWIARVLGL